MAGQSGMPSCEMGLGGSKKPILWPMVWPMTAFAPVTQLVRPSRRCSIEPSAGILISQRWPFLVCSKDELGNHSTAFYTSRRSGLPGSLRQLCRGEGGILGLWRRQASKAICEDTDDVRTKLPRPDAGEKHSHWSPQRVAVNPLALQPDSCRNKFACGPPARTAHGPANCLTGPRSD